MKIRNIFLLLCSFCCLLQCRTPDAAPKINTDPPIADPEVTIPEVISNTSSFKYWRHHPMHPGNNISVDFKTAVSDEKGIEKVELFLFEYELYSNADGLPSKRRRPGGQWGIAQAWELAMSTQVETLSYTHLAGFPAHSSVVYKFRVYNAAGEVSEQLGAFDAGTSPWPKDKILLYGATEASLQHTINVCFFPDTDYGGDWDQFLADLDTLIYEGYHRNNAIAGKQVRWRFYYTQTQTDGYALSQDFGNPDRFPSFMKDSLIYGIDAFGLLHRQPYSDGAYLMGNLHFLAHNVFTSESYNLGTAVHETAHAVFNLSDEYEGCACFEAPEGGSNMFLRRADCEAFNAANNFSDPTCTTITSYRGQKWFMPEHAVLFETEEACLAFNERNGYSLDSCFIFIDIDRNRYYRSEPGVCIMQDDGDRLVRPFQRTCRSVIESYYQRLPAIEASGEIVTVRSQVNNMFQYEPVVLMELTLDQNEVVAQPVQKAYGLPEKNLSGYQDLRLEMMDEQGQMRYHLEMDRPDGIHFEGGTQDSMAITNYGKICLAVPDYQDLDHVVCKSKCSGPKMKKSVFKIGGLLKKMKAKKERKK